MSAQSRSRITKNLNDVPLIRPLDLLLKHLNELHSYFTASGWWPIRRIGRGGSVRIGMPGCGDPPRPPWPGRGENGGEVVLVLPVALFTADVEPGVRPEGRELELEDMERRGKSRDVHNVGEISVSLKEK
ncbi:hypothetical protein B0H13DRAFT_1901572 [Mycena leptocephala]|nr:hypothetical protein B0H13DRAFT_1901572 [Mycena leptocephala]